MAWSGAKAWKFTQMGGDKKQLVLWGWSAPFGRPRQKAVVQDGVDIRETTVYYPGSIIPTRHVFGATYQPWELTGRFRDADPTAAIVGGTTGIPPSMGQPYGTGFANQMSFLCKKFILDQQRVTISWGDIITATGFIKTFEPKREAEYEVEWRMLILIDTDETTPPQSTPTVPASPFSTVQAAINALNQITKLDPGNVPIKTSIFDGIENLISSINSNFAILTSISSQIDSIEKSAMGDLRRLRAGIGQLRTAIQSLSNTYASLQNDLAITGRDVDSDVAWMSSKTKAEGSTYAALAALQSLDNKCEIAERGKTASTYVAKTGDTWERISIVVYGDISHAADIRQLNGIKYGELPIPGRAYKLPK